jgi:hypothetical protein
MNADSKSVSPSFDDKVQIRATPETEANGTAGLVGKVFGWTTPSETDVNVIGELTSDYALNVFFEKRHESFWFPAELVEFIDHAPDTEISLDGVPKKWVRNATGGWDEESRQHETIGKPWWQFWR